VRFARWLPPLAAAGFVMSGSFKEAPPFNLLPIDLTVILAVVTLLTCVARVLRTRRLSRSTGIVLLGFVFLLPAILYAPHTVYATEKVSRLFTLTLLSALAPTLLIRTTDGVRRLLWSWVAVCSGIVLIAILSPQHVADYAGAARTAVGANTIALGRAAGLVIVVTVLGAMWRRLRPSVALPLIAVSIYALLQSGSRGPLLSVVAALLAVVTLAPKRPRSVAVVGLLLLVGGGIYYSFSQAPLYARERIAVAISGGLESASPERVELFRVAWHSIQTKPLGLGLGGFASIAPGGDLYPHNLPLEVWSEAGIFLGTLFLAWLVVQLIRGRAIATDFTGSAVFASFVFMLMNTLVSGDLNDNRVMFFALGIAAATASLRSAEIEGALVAASAELQRMPEDANSPPDRTLPSSIALDGRSLIVDASFRGRPHERRLPARTRPPGHFPLNSGQ
jgi:O-antigen ligase